MHRIRFTCLGATLMALSVMVMLTAPVFSQSAKYKAPKTPWGDPDLQGQWPASANIPMQRPANLADRSTLSKEEYERQVTLARQREEADQQEFAPSAGGVTINPPGYWVERAKPHEQTSLVVDPPNGRIPPLTPAGRDVVQSLRGGLGPGQHFPEKVDSFEDFDFYSRCISRGLVSSMLPTLYNYGNHIVQGPGYVAIVNEMIHETRLIPVDGRAHAGNDIRTYMGNSRGHWEGDTLVVETTNLNDKTGTGGGYFSDSAKLTERFTRAGPNELSYDLKIDDPKTWTAPWTIHYPYVLDAEYPVIEYACHEGNYMMLESLKGARLLESQGKATKVDRGAAGGPPPGTN